MLVSDAITSIRLRTGHDTDQQINDTTMLLPWIEQETRRTRRDLTMKVPELFLSRVGPGTIAVGADSITTGSVLTAFERHWEIEKCIRGTGTGANDVWVEVPVWTTGSPYLGYREEGLITRFYPADQAPGIYRYRYLTGISAGAFTTSTNLNNAVANGGGLPLGLEEVVVERVCAIVCNRVPGDDPAPHVAEAQRIWDSHVRSLRARYGQAVKPGFRPFLRFR